MSSLYLGFVVLLMVSACCALTIDSDVVLIVQDEYEDGNVTYPVAGVNLLHPGAYVYAPVAGTDKVRIVSATATISFSDLNTGTETTTTTREWARSQGLPNDDAGHIVANRLGGSGKSPINIFPQSSTINRGVYRMFEAKISDCVNATRLDASLSWTFTYENATLPTRPTSVYYCVKYATSADCLSTCSTFSN